MICIQPFELDLLIPLVLGPQPKLIIYEFIRIIWNFLPQFSFLRIRYLLEPNFWWQEHLLYPWR